MREVQIVDPGRVRFHLKEPWPDFMTFGAYGPRVEEAGLKLIPSFPYSGPLEDLRPKPSAR